MINLWGKGGFKLMPCASSPGGFCGGRRVAAVQESGRLAPVQKHLRGVVRDRAHLWPHQCRHHGHLHLRHPAGVRKQRRRTAPGGSAPSRKAEIYRLPRADVLVGLGGGICDVGRWFLAADVSTSTFAVYSGGATSPPVRNVCSDLAFSRLYNPVKPVIQKHNVFPCTFFFFTLQLCTVYTIILLIFTC